MSERVVVITDLKQWSRWRDEWDDLLSNSTVFEARIFLSYEWLTTWWWHLGRGKLMVVAVTDGHHLLAAAPFFLSTSPFFPPARVVKFVGDGNADYGDFIARKGCEEILSVIWRWLFTHKSLWQIIALHELPNNNSAIASLRRIEIPVEFGVSMLKGEICHQIPLNQEGSSWRERASKSLKEQLKRRERQISSNFKAEFFTAESESEIATVLPQLFVLHRLRWAQLGQTGVFIFPKVREFHMEFARQALRRGWLRLHWLTLNDITASVYYAFKLGDYSGFYSCAFNPSFARYSVGKILLAKVIDEAEREGAKVFDFMRGNETYKSQFGTVTKRNFHLFVWQNRNFASRAAASLHLLSARLSSSLKRAAQR